MTELPGIAAGQIRLGILGHEPRVNSCGHGHLAETVGSMAIFAATKPRSN